MDKKNNQPNQDNNQPKMDLWAYHCGTNYLLPDRNR